MQIKLLNAESLLRALDGWHQEQRRLCDTKQTPPIAAAAFPKTTSPVQGPGCANPERDALLTITCQPELPFTLICFSLGPLLQSTSKSHQ